MKNFYVIFEFLEKGSTFHANNLPETNWFTYNTKSYFFFLKYVYSKYFEIEQQSMVHHRKYPLFYL